MECYLESLLGSDRVRSKDDRIEVNEKMKLSIVTPNTNHHNHDLDDTTWLLHV
jgi:hypothetical protein